MPALIDEAIRQAAEKLDYSSILGEDSGENGQKLADDLIDKDLAVPGRRVHYLPLKFLLYQIELFLKSF